MEGHWDPGILVFTGQAWSSSSVSSWSCTWNKQKCIYKNVNTTKMPPLYITWLFPTLKNNTSTTHVIKQGNLIISEIHLLTSTEEMHKCYHIYTRWHREYINTPFTSAQGGSIYSDYVATTYVSLLIWDQCWKVCNNFKWWGARSRAHMHTQPLCTLSKTLCKLWFPYSKEWSRLCILQHSPLSSVVWLPSKCEGWVSSYETSQH